MLRRSAIPLRSISKMHFGKIFTLKVFSITVLLLHFSSCYNELGMQTTNGLVEKRCNALQKERQYVDKVNAGLNVFSSFFSAIPFIGFNITPLLNVISSSSAMFKIKSEAKSVEIGCANIPFDEMKHIMEYGFSKNENSFNRTLGIITEISDTVHETLRAVKGMRTEMHEGFNTVYKTIFDESKFQLLTDIDMLIDYIDEQINIFETRAPVYMSMDDKIQILKDLRKKCTKKLEPNLKLILRKRYDIPQAKDDNAAFHSLEMLFRGIVSHHKAMLFLLKQYQDVRNYYYENTDLDNYNKYYSWLRTDLLNYKQITLIRDAIIHFNIVRRQDFLSADSHQSFSDQMKSLVDINYEIDQLEIPVLYIEPQKIHGAKFDRVKEEPVGRWKSAKIVRYALQYEVGGIFSTIGPWSNPLEINGQAYPNITLTIPENTMMLLFRKFDDDQPEFAGFFKPVYTDTYRHGTKFWSEEVIKDIDRDFYNAVMRDDEQGAIRDARNLLNYGAKVHSIFEKGRRAIHVAAEKNHVNLAEALLIRNMDVADEKNHPNPAAVFISGIDDANVKDNDGLTPLHIAFRYGNEKFIQLLVRKGAIFNGKTRSEELTPLHLAVLNTQVSVINAYIGMENLNVNARMKDGLSALHVAVLTNVETVRALLSSKKIDVNARSNDGSTPLILAVRKPNNLGIINELLRRRDLEVNYRCTGNLTALQIATMSGYSDVVQALLNEEAIDVNSKSIEGKTALHYAIVLRKPNIVSLLLRDRRINVNVEDNNNITPLHSAVITEQEEVSLRLLGWHRADISKKSNDGFTALHFACVNSHDKLTNHLLSYRASVTATTNEGKTALHFAVYNLEMNTIKNIIDSEKADINAKDILGYTPLHHAVIANRLPVVEYLVEKRAADYNAKDNSGVSVLELAALNDRTDIVEYFFNKEGAYRNIDIFEAIKRNYTGIVKYLVKKGINTNEPVRESLQLFTAIRSNRLHLVKYLLDLGADSTIRYKSGEHILHTAAASGSLDIVKYLVETKKISVNIKDFDNRRPVHFAALDGKIDLVKYFLDERGVDPSVTTNSGNNLLHCTIDSLKKDEYDEGQRLNLIKYLVEEKNVSMSAQDNNGRTPFFTAAMRGYLNILKYLSDKTFNTNLTDKNGNTPLHWAVQYGHLEMAKFLVEKMNVYVNTVNFEGLTALEIATKKNYQHLHRYLEGKGAVVKYEKTYSPSHKGIGDEILEFGSEMWDRMFS